MIDKKQLGEKIKNMREKKGYTIYGLSIQIDVGDSNLGRIERGEQNITASIAVAIANEFGLTITELLSNDKTTSISDYSRIENYLSSINSNSDLEYLLKLLLKIKSL